MNHKSNKMTKTEECYDNAYRLLIGETSYDILAESEVFYLPLNHDNPEVVLGYYESIGDYGKLLKYYTAIEDYERCAIIVKRQQHETCK